MVLFGIPRIEKFVASGIVGAALAPVFSLNKKAAAAIGCTAYAVDLLATPVLEYMGLNTSGNINNDSASVNAISFGKGAFLSAAIGYLVNRTRFALGCENPVALFALVGTVAKVGGTKLQEVAENLAMGNYDLSGILGSTVAATLAAYAFKWNLVAAATIGCATFVIQNIAEAVLGTLDLRKKNDRLNASAEFANVVYFGNILKSTVLPAVGGFAGVDLAQKMGYELAPGNPVVAVALTAFTAAYNRKYVEALARKAWAVVPSIQ